MQNNNHMQRNNPWGFQAQNWSQPMTRGPPPGQHPRPNMNRFGSPGQRPNFQPRGYNQGMGSPRQGITVQNPGIRPPHQGVGPRMLHGQPRFHDNQTFCGNHSQFQGQYQQQQDIQGQVKIQHPGQMFNRPHNRPMTGPPPDFFRAPGNNQQRPRFQKGKHQDDKKRVDKRDLPENNRFYCDSCDRGYKDEDKYKLHCDQHQKCPKEGCTYIAAGKLVQMHIKLQHNTGMAKKIWSLESKADIQKWIEERKKNFPTAANIEKKKELLAERIARGEVIEEKYFGKMHRRDDNRRGRGRGRGRDRGRGRGNRGDGSQQNDMKRKLNDTETDECTVKKQAKESPGGEESVMKEAAESLSMFFAADSSDSDSTDSEGDDNDKSIKMVTGNTSSTVPEVTAAGALGNLMSSYVVSDESSDDVDTAKPENVGGKKISEPSKDHRVTNGEQNNNDNDIKKPRQRTRGRQKRNKEKWNPTPNLDKSLLEKLLAKEIRQERNKIMQCVHYIVKNNFFDNVKNTENKT